MLLPAASFELAYKHIKLHAINNRSKVLVCVAGDCDSISACHIMTVRKPHLPSRRLPSLAPEPPTGVLHTTVLLPRNADDHAPCCCRCAPGIPASHDVCVCRDSCAETTSPFQCIRWGGWERLRIWCRSWTRTARASFSSTVGPAKDSTVSTLIPLSSVLGSPRSPTLPLLIAAQTGTLFSTRMLGCNAVKPVLIIQDFSDPMSLRLLSDIFFGILPVQTC